MQSYTKSKIEIIPCEEEIIMHSRRSLLGNGGFNRLVSQMLVPRAACREPAGKLWQLCKALYVLEHKTQYLLIHAPFVHIVVFRHMSNMPQ